MSILERPEAFAFQCGGAWEGKVRKAASGPAPATLEKERSVHLFNGMIPLIAIQMRALRVGNLTTFLRCAQPFMPRAEFVPKVRRAFAEECDVFAPGDFLKLRQDVSIFLAGDFGPLH